MITQSELKELLTYNQETGKFIWLVNISKKMRIGSRAGSLSNTTLYRYIKVLGTLYSEHRLAVLYMTSSFPEEDVDHINHKRDDNIWSNLRCVTRSENLKNQSIRSDNSSGVTGVSWHKASNKWRCLINHDGERIYLGTFSKFSEALDARKLAEVAYGYHNNHGK